MNYTEFVRMCQSTDESLNRPTYVESPNPDAVLHRSTDPVVVQPNGVLLQRCGGGRRVLRKRIGSH